MRLLQFLRESTGIKRYDKYFNNPGNHFVYNKTEKVALYSVNDIENDDSLYKIKPILIINNNEDVYVYGGNYETKLSMSGSYFVKIRYKNQDYYINVNHIKTPFSDRLLKPLYITTNDLLKSHNKTTQNIFDENVSGYYFENISDLINTLKIGFKKSTTETISSVMEKFLDGRTYNRIDWTDEISIQDRNTLGAYFGEILYVLLLFSRQHSSFSGLPNEITNNRITGFFFPSSSNFKYFDSMIHIDNSYWIRISNKKGKGAASSLFNQFDELIKMRQHGSLKSNILNHFLTFYINSSSQLDAIYKWAFDPSTNYLYNLTRKLYNISEARNIFDFFRGICYRSLDIAGGFNPKEYENMTINDFRRFEKNRGVLWMDDIGALMYIFKHMNPGMFQPSNDILNNLPHSMSSILCKELATRFNNDKLALEDFKKVLNANDFYQLNLSAKDFNNGNVKYTFNKSGSFDIKISGPKSSSRNIDLKQGRLNYTIK